MFVVCLVGVWQRNFEPVVCVYGPSDRTHTHPGSKLRSKLWSKHVWNHVVSRGLCFLKGKGKSKGKDKSKAKGQDKLSLYKPNRPCGFQEVEAPRLYGSWYIKVLSLSALRTDHFYPPGNIAGTNLC